MNSRIKTAAAVSAAVLALWAGAFNASAVENESADVENTEIIVNDSEINPVLESSGDVEINETNFPDATFRAHVATLDTDGNGSLSQAEINKVTSIDVSGTLSASNTVADLTGIEHFAKLIELDCSYNQLTSLDISQNTALQYLSCQENRLRSLNVSVCTALKELRCSDNYITNLDVSSCTSLEYLSCIGNLLASLDVSKNTELKDFYCDSNSLTSLDVSQNTALVRFWCTDNLLTSLDVSKNTALDFLWCSSNQLTSLDVSGSTALGALWCCSNQLTSLDVSGKTALENIDCSDNLLTSLNISGCTALTELNCAENQLTSLDVSNNSALTELYCSYNTYSIGNVSGSYSLANLPGFDPAKASDWQGAEYDSSTKSLKNFTNKTVTYNYDCGNGYTAQFELTGNLVSNQSVTVAINETNFPDATFRAYVATLDTDGNGSLSQAEINEVRIIDVSGTSDEPNTIADLTGIEHFTKLTSLDCSCNQLTSLDVSKNTVLTFLYCPYNRLTRLDVSGCTDLTQLICRENKLTSLDVSKNTALTMLYCSFNQLTSLDVSKNTALTELDCGFNQLTSLDVSRNTSLTAGLWCGDNLLTNLDVSKNTDLICLSCYKNQLTSLDLSKNTALKYLECSENSLISLDVSQNTDLIGLYCSNNQLTSLDLSKNTALTDFDSSENTYSIGDVSGSYSLANLPGFDPTKASDWQGAEYDSSTKSLKNFTSNTVTYNYDCGNGYTAEFKLVANSYTSGVTKVDPPSFAIKGVFGGRNVTFNCNTPGATIYYTTEGRSTLKLTDPHVDSGETVLFTAYYGTVYARAYYNGKWSNPARLILKIPKVNTPTITKLDNGKYKIKTTTPGTIVYYTTDGTTPSATNYKGKFWTSHDVSIPAGKTVKAIAVRTCFSDSDVATAKT